MSVKILFAAPNHFGIYKRIINDFLNSGYEVTSICIEDWPEKRVLGKKKKLHKLRLLINPKYRKSFTEHLIKSESEIPDFLKSFRNDYFDICFFIRPDFFSFTSIKHALKVSKKSLAYQWDGLDRYPNIIDKISLFDKFLVFDKKDYNKYQGLHNNIDIGSNFYFNYDEDIPERETIDVFYLGAFVHSRNLEMFKIYNHLKTLSLNIKILLCQIPIKVEDSEQYSNQDIHFINKIMDYKEGLSYTKSSNIIIDLLINEHSGLSFRFFEAIKYNKKVITTNPTVINEDFYKSENIFIFNDNLNELDVFLNKEYKKLPAKIVKKYSFLNWFESHTSTI